MAARVAALGYAHPGGRLYWGGVKAFADGSLGSRTALMHAAYADAPGQRGRRMMDLGALRAAAARADAAGLQVAVHAIGDRAVDDVLEVFEAVEAANALPRRAPAPRGGPPPPLRTLRLEHAQHLSGERAAARLGALAGAAAAVANPQHLAPDAAMLEARLGPARAAPDRAFAWPAMMAAGAAVAAGSDWPIVDLRPFEGLAAAAARLAPPGAGGAPRAARDAARMHTAVAADAAFVMGARLGRLVPRRKADFLVLPASPLDAGPEGFAAARVAATYVDGRCAHGCGGVPGASSRASLPLPQPLPPRPPS
jgi:predicted amidohydrolase YtcJ